MSLRTVCGLDELGLHGRSGLTHVLSILDPGYPTPEVFRAYDDHDKLELRFHDAIEPSPGIQVPTETDVAAILEFGARLRDRDDDGEKGTGHGSRLWPTPPPPGDTRARSSVSPVLQSPVNGYFLDE